MCYNLHVEINVWWLCDVCLCFDACCQLINSLAEEGNGFIQRGIMGKMGQLRGRTVFFV